MPDLGEHQLRHGEGHGPARARQHEDDLPNDEIAEKEPDENQDDENDTAAEENESEIGPGGQADE